MKTTTIKLIGLLLSAISLIFSLTYMLFSSLEDDIDRLNERIDDMYEIIVSKK